MDKEQLASEIQALERKIKVLLSEYNDTKSHLHALEAENKELKRVIQQKDEQIQNFKNKINISTIVRGIDTDNENVDELVNKIDTYIAEIDKCVLHLSK